MGFTHFPMSTTVVPEIYSFVYQSFANSSSLFFGGTHKIESREGVHQYDSPIMKRNRTDTHLSMQIFALISKISSNL